MTGEERTTGDGEERAVRHLARALSESSWYLTGGEALPPESWMDTAREIVNTKMREGE